MNLRYEIPQAAENIEDGIRKGRLPERWFDTLDHIAIKTANPDHYNQIIKDLKSGVLLRPFSAEISRIVEARIQNRRIAIAELVGQMAVGNWSIEDFEVIEPRAEMIGKFKAGVDHFEFFSEIPLTELEKRLEQVFGIVPILQSNSWHRTLSFPLGTNRTEVKFTDWPIHDVIANQLMLNEAEVI
jgi:hypothetical protein